MNTCGKCAWSEILSDTGGQTICRRSVWGGHAGLGSVEPNWRACPVFESMAPKCPICHNFFESIDGWWQEGFEDPVCNDCYFRTQQEKQQYITGYAP